MNLLYLNIYHHVIYIYASVTGVVFLLLMLYGQREGLVSYLCIIDLFKKNYRYKGNIPGKDGFDKGQK